MCIRDRVGEVVFDNTGSFDVGDKVVMIPNTPTKEDEYISAVSYTHLRAHETVLDLVCRLLLEKKKKQYTQLTHHYYIKLKRYNTI